MLCCVGDIRGPRPPLSRTEHQALHPRRQHLFHRLAQLPGALLSALSMKVLPPAGRILCQINELNSSSVDPA